MTERNEPWPTGTPCWVDLISPDVTASRSFYGDLFGWEINDSPPEFGGYVMAMVDGRAVAALSPVPPGQSLPTAWTTYLATDDADATSAAIDANGGKVTLEPIDVETVGRFGLATDPTGAAFGLWQAGQHIGMGLANVANTCTWNELMTGDYAAAKTFYAAVFDVTFEEMGDGNFEYSTIQKDGRDVGGIGAGSRGAPSKWGVYFACTDTDQAVARAVELGATVQSPATDSPYGRMATITDPQGAAFSLVQLGSAVMS